MTYLHILTSCEVQALAHFQSSRGPMPPGESTKQFPENGPSIYDHQDHPLAISTPFLGNLEHFRLYFYLRQVSDDIQFFV